MFVYPTGPHRESKAGRSLKGYLLATVKKKQLVAGTYFLHGYSALWVS